MKSFRFKYTVLIWVLLTAILWLSLAGVGWNIFNVIEFSRLNAVKTTTYSIILVFSALLCIVVIGVMVYGKYVIKDGKLYTCFGFIRTKIEVEKITAVINFKKSDKLVIYFNQNKYAVVVISPSEYDNFISTLREVNPKIAFDNRIDGEDTPA